MFCSESDIIWSCSTEDVQSFVQYEPHQRPADSIWSESTRWNEKRKRQGQIQLPSPRTTRAASRRDSSVRAGHGALRVSTILSMTTITTIWCWSTIWYWYLLCLGRVRPPRSLVHPTMIANNRSGRLWLGYCTCFAEIWLYADGCLPSKSNPPNVIGDGVHRLVRRLASAALVPGLMISSSSVQVDGPKKCPEFLSQQSNANGWTRTLISLLLYFQDGRLRLLARPFAPWYRGDEQGGKTHSDEWHHRRNTDQAPVCSVRNF